MRFITRRVYNAVAPPCCVLVRPFFALLERCEGLDVVELPFVAFVFINNRNL